MPTYLITAPDGRKFRVTGEGSKEEALAQIQGTYQAPQPEMPADPTEGMGTFDKLRAGFGKAFVDLGRGIAQLNDQFQGPSAQEKFGLATDTADEAAAARAQRRAASEQAVIDQRALDAPLMATGAGKVGNLAGNIAAVAPTAFIPGANTATGSALVGAGLGLLQPAASGQERALNTGLGGALGMGGQWLGNKIANSAGNRLATRQASAASAQSQNSVRDQTLREGLAAGLVAPPATTNPTMANTALESIAGKAATQSAAARINQPMTNKLIRSDIGIADDVPLTKEALKRVRDDAGKAYAAIKNSGDVVADDQYLDEVIDLVGGNTEVSKQFPGAKLQADDSVVQLADSLLQPKFSAGAAIEYAKRLRSQARDNFKAAYASGGAPEKLQLAHAQWNAAGALEDAIERNLQQQGRGELATLFNQARVTIAKSYSAEAALNEGTGNIVASKLVTQLKKGKPLSGGFETVAKFAQAAPKAMAEPTQSGGVSALSALVAGGGVALGQPGLIALPVARLLTKRAILSRSLQQRMAVPKYQPSRTGSALLQSSRGLGRVGGPLAASTYATEQ